MHHGSGSLRGAASVLVAVILHLGVATGQLAQPESLGIAAELVRQERFAEARKILETLVQDSSNVPAEAYYHLAVCDARQGRRHAADTNLDLALARDSGYLPAVHLKAYFEFSAGRYSEALGWTGHYLDQRPDGGETRKISGLARFMLGDRPGAELDLKRAASLLPQDFDAHYYLGRVYFEGSKLTLALSAFRKAIELDPRSAKARNHLGQTLEGLTRFEEAGDAYRDAIHVEKEGAERSEWPYYNLGSLLLAEGDTEKAVTLLEEALARNPSSLQTRTRLGAAYSAASRLADAEKQLRAAVLEEPTNADAHYQLGRVLMKLGLKDEGRKHLALFERFREP